ncbi:TPA: tail fiber assembly protein [Salmonella enterica]|nr:tail fiber assembly protein [Salmonella enterica]MCH5740321.1 tail fiber assembly protein [Salmonella enterica]MCH5745341.1 tail fiber assembly protein [Salmonella enterica]MCH5750331.1 tail fiber assembly protein [Salmonella enterica]MCH5760239.1 tail fiber assembly protein [Salmonella enterica]
MQIFTDFQVVEPTEKQLQAFENPEGYVPIFLRSAEGQDWYESFDLFSDDTVKLMFNSDGVIVSIVDAPVPERGDIYAVSMFFPDGLSVAEIEGMLPEGFELDSRTWVYRDGTVEQDQTLLDAYNLAINQEQYRSRVNELTNEMLMLQAAITTGRATEKQQARFTALQNYAVDLSEVDLTQAKPDWPDNPL